MTSLSDPGLWPSDRIAAQVALDAPCGFLVTDLRGRVLFANPALAGWLGQRAEDLVAKARLSDILSSESQLYFETQIAPMVRLEGAAREISCKLRAESDTTPQRVLMNATLRSATDEFPDRIDFVFFDASSRLGFEAHLREARNEAEELAAIVRSAAVGIMRCDEQGYIKRHNTAVAGHFDIADDRVKSAPVDELLPLEGEEKWFLTSTKAIMATGETRRFEAKARTQSKYFDISVTEISNPEAPYSAREYSVILRDVTEQVLTLQRLDMVAGEMQHRIRNVFTVITALVKQSLRRVPHERDKLTHRLTNLSTSHNILTANHWQSAEIGALICPLQDQIGDRQRLSHSGPEVRLGPSQFKALSMAFHELFTNAQKYGALSATDGVVEIEWSLSGAAQDHLALSWRESGGPEITAPEDSGFGSIMIDRMLSAEFDGTVECRYPPSGLEFQFEGTVMPLEGPDG
ncbi:MULTISPECIES: sensor histidine kinase [unclassified Marinovum]